MTKFKDPKVSAFTIERRVWYAFRDVCLNQSLETSFVLRELIKSYIDDRRKAEREYDPYAIPTKELYDTGEEKVAPAEQLEKEEQVQTQNEQEAVSE